MTRRLESKMSITDRFGKFDAPDWGAFLFFALMTLIALPAPFLLAQGGSGFLAGLWFFGLGLLFVALPAFFALLVLYYPRG